jgi:hypothetical protein
LDLKKGQNEVLIKNLPSVLDGDSVRVDGIGKAIVFDVIYSKLFDARRFAPILTLFHRGTHKQLLWGCPGIRHQE